jgi:hypothetical protein
MAGWWPLSHQPQSAPFVFVVPLAEALSRSAEAVYTLSVHPAEAVYTLSVHPAEAVFTLLARSNIHQLDRQPKQQGLAADTC